MAESSVDATLFQNVRIFDGKDGAVSVPSDVLVEGSRIARISASTLPIDADRPVTVVVGGGRVLMPGLIDAHWHAMFATLPIQVLSTADIGYVNLAAGREAEATLMRGFTTVRDLGGPVFGLKRAIDDGVVVGPRIYPSGAFISQTSGHGDFRLPYEVPRTPGDPLSYLERVGVSAIADSPDEVRLRAREQLRQGASQLKLMAGGGVSSPYDPLDTTQYTEAEMCAAVEAAENWGTYVAVHAFTPRAIRIAVAAGVKCIDHGQLIDEPTTELLAQRVVWLSLQPVLDDEDAIPLPDPALRQKAGEVYSGTDTAYTLAKQYGVKVAFGTDTLFSPRLATRQGAQLAKLVRWYGTAEVLKMATADNAELLALSGPRNPYPGTLGVVQEGALADLLLVDGNPLENIELIADPARNFLVIMKNGQIYKNLLAA
jgi:imidazolonepropionase-like amidohydrolase